MSVPPELVALAASYVQRNIATIYDTGKGFLDGAKDKVRLRLKGTYSEYIKSAGARYGRSKSFFIRSAPTNIYDFYVPWSVTCGETQLKSVSILEIEKLTKRAIITGTAGCGKSILLRHLFLSSLDKGNRIPVFVELRTLSSFDEPVSLLQLIETSLSNHQFDLGSDYIKAAISKGHFVILLDGLDEVPVNLKKRISREIVDLSSIANDCLIILSSRSDDSFSNWEEFSNLSVNPLELDDACTLILKLPHDDEIKKKFVKGLRESLFDQHKSFLSNPLLLSIMLLTYGQYAEIPSKLSLFYDQAYEALFQKHDALKGGFQRDRRTKLDIQDFAKFFSAFCLRTYDQRKFQLTRTECLLNLDKSKSQIGIEVSSADFLDDCLQSVCLLVEDGMQVAFAHRSFQEFFVAKFINESAPANQRRLIDRFAHSLHGDSIFVLLHEMNKDLVEREFIIPRLEKIFDKIKVKRQVGITHYLRYMQNRFSAFHFDSRQAPLGFYFDGNNRNVDQPGIILFALTTSPEYDITTDVPKKRFNEEWEEITARYGKDDQHVVYSLDNLTINSPVLRDISKTSGYVGLNCLEAAYRRLKALQKKHQNAVRSLDVLLK